MSPALRVAHAGCAVALLLAACAPASDQTIRTSHRTQVLDELQRQAGAPISLEVGAAGDLRVLAMTPRFPIPAHDADPSYVAMDFVTGNHDLFQLDATEARQFIATRVDDDPATELVHVTLNRSYNGIPVFQGAITIHMDAANRVFRVLGDEAYRIAPPINRATLTPAEAALAAGRALGVALSPVLVESTDQSAVFTSAGALDPIRVDPKIFHVAEGDDRFAFQATVAWLDDNRQQQYELALIDAQDGALLARYSLVNTFTGRVFNADAQPTANQSSDTRTVVSFDGNPATSPIGWVGAGRTTVGNNAVAATDIDGNNTVGSNEVQPVADANNRFEFPYSATQDATSFRAAAVTNAFFYANDWHDRAYMVGFTEAAGNFQTNNFGKGGAQNDPVNIDVQDGSGVNNTSFSTPPDGSRPRMQLFLFNIKNGAGGVRQDAAFDPSVVYHEQTHGMSSRLVGGGSAGCLGGLQSGGMGEGWSDWVAAGILDNPVIGAYITGNAVTGVRRASMASSPFTLADVKNGKLADSHDVGELWAAVLWDARAAIGGPVVCSCVVTGMKMTPCSPTLLHARDALLQADAAITGGANRCKLWKVFAARLMGVGASSPNHNSTSQIITSSAIPADCR